MERHADANTVIRPDGEGRASLILHLQNPYKADAPDISDLSVAVDYLATVQGELGVTDEQISFLRETMGQIDDSGSGPASTATGVQLRWRQRRILRGEASIVVIQQTFAIQLPERMHQIDVFGGGIRIVVHRLPDQPWQVSGVASTLHHEFRLKPEGAIEEFASDYPQVVTEILDKAGLPIPEVHILDAIPPQHWIYRYQPEQRPGNGPAELEADLVPGTDYVAVGARVVYRGGTPELPDLDGHDLVARWPDLALLSDRTLTTHAMAAPPQGKVFLRDPVTRLGDFAAARPNADSVVLDPLRQGVPLANLNPPMPNWHLAGSQVFVFDPTLAAASRQGSIGIVPPSVAPGTDFDYSVRTNDFAAVNAYVHCDSMFQMIADFGLPFVPNPEGIGLPVEVLHRAAIHPGPCGDGRCINAQAKIVAPVPSTPAPAVAPPPAPLAIQFRFALADFELNPGTPQTPIAPLGIACDVRWVWHEFGHALLAASTGELELPFVHSTGDALAAIMCDPGSKLAEGALEAEYRGVTFPWAAYPLRRHDRRADDGWSWSTPIGERDGYTHDITDLFGYRREQVLSSTLFRLYRSVGGDSVAGGAPDVPARQAAANYLVFLIVKAIAMLGPANATPANNAAIFAATLMVADASTVKFAYGGNERPGGTVHKVIRWAFEKQGLYVRSNLPPTADGSGHPPPVDIYIDDGRGGEYQPPIPAQAPDTALWNTLSADATAAHADPVSGTDNYIHVVVANRGDQPANAAKLSVWVAGGSTGLIWPGAIWQPLPLAAVAGATDTASIPGGGTALLGPFQWKPGAPGAVTVVASVDVPGDRSNLELGSGLPCAAGPTPIGLLVPFDNNLGLRIWTAS